jgi:TetR/AcrR family transcriptional repressor of nem operon
VSPRASHAPARTALLAAATRLVREKGFAATSVDDLCAAAGVTKGAFFHHFVSKESLGVAAANYWAETTGAFFAAAPYHAPAEPLARVFAYLDFRQAILEGEIAEFTCLVGTMVQEVHESSPAIRAACEASIVGHSETLVPDIAAALAAHGVTGVEPRGLALHFQAVLQGAFIVAKATGSADVARASVAHLRKYVALLCGVPVPAANGTRR